MNKSLQDIGQEMLQELTKLLNYWSTEAIDEKNGGFIGQIKNEGIKNWKAEKGMVLNARILWTFSSAFRVTKNPEYKKMADRAYGYLMQFFWDSEEAGFIWSVTHEGVPLNTRKQTYAQGFGIYALSEYNRATGHKDSLEYARQLYLLLETKCKDTVNGGYIEALKKDWSELEDMRLSPKDANTPKSMNTHLHILEPYTNLYRVWPDAHLKQSIQGLLEIFQTKIINTETGHFNLFFNMDWSVQSATVSYGHDIEGAWLLHEAAIEIKEPDLIKGIRRTALRLVDVTLQEGIDKDSSIYYEKEGYHLDTDKHWWPQAEAMVGLYDAWEINKDETYLNHIENIWVFINEYIVDNEYGEWFWSVDKNGVPQENEDKVGFWKCPYHNTRALIEIYERINKNM